MGKKHKIKNNTNKYNIVKLFKEIEKELGVEDYNKLQDSGINRNMLEKIEYIIFEKYIDSIDIIELNLRSYIRDIEPKHSLFQPINYINVYLVLYSLIINIVFEILEELNFASFSFFTVIVLYIYYFDIGANKYQNDENFKLAKILLDIIDMNESKVKQ